VDTPLGPDALVLQRFRGEEGMSIPYHFTLELLSEDDKVDPAKLLRQPVTITVALTEGERKIHGLVRRFTQTWQRDDLTAYTAEVVPWLWFLTLSQDCKIFQNKSVLEIVQEVFDGLGYSDYEIRCSRSYVPREYCVQYRESHFNFVTRLLEEEGIFFFFEHSEGKHLLVLGDMNSTCPACPGQSTARMATDEGPWQDEDVVTALTLESAVHLGKVTLRDYDFTRPSLNLETSVAGKEPEELYEYPGRYVDLGEGERYAQLLLEEGECGGTMVRGGGVCRAFVSGHKFDLTEHYRSDANQPYLLVHASHVAEAGDYRTWDTAPLQYQNEFVCIPTSVPYRPPRRARKPRIHGSQTAMVVGKSGEEIFTDEYGRIKVQFYWDRLGRKDQNSSCWVRVSYPWAGKGWGGIHIPRIGQEVIVEFLEGDPDRPIVSGRVYNAEQTVPYGLPANRTQSGVKSRSSLGGGGDNFNEIRMEDKKGSEQLYIHAEKDKQVVVENDRTESVGHDETISIGHDRKESVGNDETIDIGNNRTETVGNDETITIAGNRTESVSKSESVTITLTRTHTVGINDALSVGAAQEVSVGGLRALTVGLNQDTSIGKNESVSVGSDQTVNVGKKRSVSVGDDDSLKVAKKLLIDAGDEITIKTGKASIVMKKDGTITISGKDLTVKGSGKIDVKASKDITMKGKNILQN
jgi:type VI secretion system secreted protein VgrG